MIGGKGFSLVFLMLGVRYDDDAKMKLHVEMTPECSRATSAAAHGVHGCCSMQIFFDCARMDISLCQGIELDRG